MPVVTMITAPSSDSACSSGQTSASVAICAGMPVTSRVTCSVFPVTKVGVNMPSAAPPASRTSTRIPGMNPAPCSVRVAGPAALTVIGSGRAVRRRPAAVMTS
ncbi:MAG: hypothetical protein BWY09_01748 [Candidatus Hydrogenedentes bacterium ADurb.Bin179]|nr:MAG: hypothetical protein BWY09_01748 [Candidatus Hydrogenedentes bacterium ADurb.Bin179]